MDFNAWLDTDNTKRLKEKAEQDPAFATIASTMIVQLYEATQVFVQSTYLTPQDIHDILTVVQQCWDTAAKGAGHEISP